MMIITGNRDPGLQTPEKNAQNALKSLYCRKGKTILVTVKEHLQG